MGLSHKLQKLKVWRDATLTHFGVHRARLVLPLLWLLLLPLLVAVASIDRVSSFSSFRLPLTAPPLISATLFPCLRPQYFIFQSADPHAT